MFNSYQFGKSLVKILRLFQDFMKKQNELNTLYEDKINMLIDRIGVLEDEIRDLKKTRFII